MHWHHAEGDLVQTNLQVTVRNTKYLNVIYIPVQAEDLEGGGYFQRRPLRLVSTRTRQACSRQLGRSGPQSIDQWNKQDIYILISFYMEMV